MRVPKSELVPSLRQNFSNRKFVRHHKHPSHSTNLKVVASLFLSVTSVQPFMPFTPVTFALAAAMATAIVPLPAQAFGPVSLERQAHDAVVEIYEYAYPLVLMGVTRQTMLSNTSSATRVTVNRFLHKTEFPDPKFHDVVRPNADTLYSIAWLDVSKEPMILSVPDTQGRYYVMQMLDAWTEVFAAPGKRTTGTQPGDFAIVGPGWRGTLPAGVSRLNSGTNYVWIIGRTQTNGEDDLKAVHIIQNGYKLMPLGAYVTANGDASAAAAAQQANSQNHSATPAIEIDVEVAPAKQVAAMDATKFFSVFAQMLKSNPPHKEDAAMLSKMKLLGIESGADFDPEKLSSQVKEALETGTKEAKSLIEERGKTLGAAQNGWMVERKIGGTYGNDYLDRAAVAMSALGMNRFDDAIYPFCFADGNGQALSGANKYVLHFDRNQLPPVKAFWSLSLYDSDGYFVENSINRYCLGDRDKLSMNADGSLDIYLQSDNPGKDKEANWLPTPPGASSNFNLLMRLYWPKSTVVSGLWSPPAVKKQD